MMVESVPSLADRIKDSFDAASLLLVFVTVLFGIRYAEVHQLLDASAEQNPKARSRQRANIVSGIVGKLAPFLVLAMLPAFIFLPTTVEAIRSSDFHLWNFDLVVTGFVAVACLMWGFVLWGIHTLYLLARKWRSLREPAGNGAGD
jgi:hypothetical protein